MSFDFPTYPTPEKGNPLGGNIDTFDYDAAMWAQYEAYPVRVYISKSRKRQLDDMLMDDVDTVMERYEDK